MAYEFNEGQGSLFRNKYKQEGSRQPEYNGQAKINGRMMRISAWVRQTQSGEKYFSLSISEPQPQQSAPAPQAAPTASAPVAPVAHTAPAPQQAPAAPAVDIDTLPF